MSTPRFPIPTTHLTRLARLPRTAALALSLVCLATPAGLRAQDAEARARLDALTRAVEGQLATVADKEAYLFTDKPLYHPGEAIWFRAFEVSRKTMSRVEAEHGVTFELLDPRGAKIAEKRVLAKSGVATNDFVVPAGAAGGTYTLRATSSLGPKEERTLTVSTYEIPRVKKTIEFGRTTYAPGDRVTATITLERATGEPLTSAKVWASIKVDGAEIARISPVVDAKGKAFVVFDLPRRIDKGDVFLSLNVDAGGVAESIERRVPVTLDQVTATAFPEGGDLVVGLPSRVYVAGRDPRGQPAEIEGRVMDDTGRLVTTFKSVHAGMARFALTPAAGRSYSIKLVKPARDQAFPIPTARPSGCVMETKDDYTAAQPDIHVQVRCSGKERVLATAVVRERLVARTAGEVAPDKVTELTLPVAGAEGAARVTLWTEDQKPLAERLVYRGLGHGLRVTVTADKAAYVPREKVTLTVKATDESGAPVKADLALAVVDDAVLNLADDKSANILADLYLLPEMPGQRIHEPNFYFSSDKKAPEAMDLLLGTQGFRRFAWKWVPAGAPTVVMPP